MGYLSMGIFLLMSYPSIKQWVKLLILINPMQLKDLSPSARAFVIGHVCANLTLGHLARPVENIYHHYDRVGNADCSVAAKLFIVAR